METLAVRVTHFFLQKHYIESDQAEWFQYGLVRRMMGALTFLLLLPIGAIVVGLGGSFFFLLVFRFLRTRTGGYHAKTPHGCLLASLSTMLIALSLANCIQTPFLGSVVLFGAALFVVALAPANNASLHLTADELAAIRPRGLLRLGVVLLVGYLFLQIYMPIGSCVAVSLLAVAVMLILANLGFGVQ